MGNNAGNLGKTIVAFVGMPGAGKSEAAAYLKKKGIPFVRFGDLTDEVIQQQGLAINQESERLVREELRKDLGMAAYAIKSKPKIEDLLVSHAVIGIDGLYSWEEYLYLKKEFPGLLLIHVYTEQQTRYQRLSKRPVRPLGPETARQRDIAEIEKLNKAGPIALADYTIDNNQNWEHLYQQIDHLLERLQIQI